MKLFYAKTPSVILVRNEIISQLEFIIKTLFCIDFSLVNFGSYSSAGLLIQFSLL